MSLSSITPVIQTPLRLSAILTVLSDCGFTHNTDEGIKDGLKAKAPHLAHEIDQLYFGTFGSSDK
jgi:hypothetical protein